MDLLFGILVIFGIALVAALVFGGWVIVAILRLAGRMLGGLFAPPPAPRLNVQLVRCGHPRCRADNPGRARFCRRCGKMLHAPRPAVARQAAMW
jgi:hypothetical protein